MNKIITYGDLRKFAYVNDKICTKPIKGIVLSFFGLGGSSMYDKDMDVGVYYAQKGILYVIPYTNPWAWMNSQTVSYTDEILDVLFEQYSLPEDTPVVSTGGSMGGLSALVYTRYAKRTPVACVANCPVCDLPYHYTERNDLPRTLYSAFFQEEGDLEEILKTASPLHLASEMPKIKYVIFHCEEDKAVNKAMHSDRFVEAIQGQGLDVTYHAVPQMGHCALTVEMRGKYLDYPVEVILGSAK